MYWATSARAGTLMSMATTAIVLPASDLASSLGPGAVKDGWTEYLAMSAFAFATVRDWLGEADPAVDPVPGVLPFELLHALIRPSAARTVAKAKPRRLRQLAMRELRTSFFIAEPFWQLLVLTRNGGPGAGGAGRTEVRTRRPGSRSPR